MLIGEICVAGKGVANGYLNNPTITAKNFINNPFGDGLLYKTGDLGKYLENGEIEYIGRLDNQIKIRGLRIELGEIEDKITKLASVNNCIVIKKGDNLSREYLCAYFTANTKIDIRNMRKSLEKTLPQYMVPSYFTQLDELPQTINGKIDTKSLPLPMEELATNIENYVAPKTELQKYLVNIWEGLLNHKPIGINDNFFEIGGDSLLAMNLNIELLKLSNNISYADIFRYPTIIELEKLINSSNNKPTFNKIENLPDSFADILDKNTQKSKTSTFMPKNMLLTGSTGFLGVHILQQFIENSSVNIYCIVRNGKNITAKEKLYKNLHYYFGNKYDYLIGKRIFIVTGDISKPKFGLDKENLSKFIDSIDVVINCAANVSHFGKYEDFYNSNVESLNHIIATCEEFKIKLYHISTTSISGDGPDISLLNKKKRKKHILLNESSLYTGQIINNVYAYSKFEAEISVLDAITKGLDAYILRMGNLMPRYLDGKFQKNIQNNAFANKITSFMKIKMVPDYLLKYELEFTPVDYAANAIYKIVTNTTEKNRVFHLCNHHTISVKKFIALLKKQNINMHILNSNEFKTKIKEMLNNDTSKELLKYLIDDFDENLNLNYSSDIIIKSKYTIKYLRKVKFKWPKITKTYLNRFIDLLRRGM